MAEIADGLEARIDDGIARLTINRPHRKNAVTQAMWRALADQAQEWAGGGDVRVLILTGEGVDFSAGADIGEFDTVRRDAQTARAYEQANSDAFSALREAPFPVIAAISGICFGGGLGLAAACDLRLATPDATFAVPAARLGLAYPQEAMIDIVTAAGAQMAKWLTYSAARITAAQALSAGFLLEIEGDRTALDARATAMAETIAANAPLSVRASKAAIRAVTSKAEADAALARSLGSATFDSADYAEGRSAFREKRKPVFQGR
ncbi:enoyl-CoA hydratase-related protein [Zhengella sp. ZM62]|uniref:enoyl-CoA hydratase-related protein n=1 Tax=Zhengella sedimenti TaxID=3390035 RepID=UPI0039769BBC